MANAFSTLTFTPSVQAAQQEMGSRHANERMEEYGPEQNTLSSDEREFIAARDSFYMATVGETGWPYLQHRGGPAGFLHVVDDRTLAFADVVGNRQYISLGNLHANNRVALFLMDYPHQTRLKVLAHAETIPWADAPAWKSELQLHDRARPERVFLLHINAFSWNCPQQITPRWTAEELAVSPLGERIRRLEAENAALRQQIKELGVAS